MNAVRYYSKSGNTKKIAEAIAEGIGVNAISITDEQALQEKVVLFTTSNWSHRTVHGLKKILENKGITVEKDHFYAQMLMVNSKVKAAMAAPSAGNQQPWEYYVVTNRELIKKLAETSPYAGCAANAPAVIIPCLKTEGLIFPQIAEIDLAITTENILLEITSLGLGGVWLGIAPLADRIEKVDALLGIGDKLHAFALVPLGYPAEDRPQQDRYDENRIHYVD